MANYSALLILITTLITSSATEETTSTSNDNDIVVAIHEMQTATYFSFALLINMYQPHQIPHNVTFLMPNDRMLSQVSLAEEGVYNFLLRHSIPSPLLFDHLERFPTGSIVPTSEPDFMLRILNRGRRNFYLNNVQIVNPNICTAGSSIRCHGIKGVINASYSLSTCHPPFPPDHAPARPSAPAGPTKPVHPSLLPQSPLSQISAAAPPPMDFDIGSSNKSGSLQLSARDFFQFILPCIILVILVTIRS